MRLTFGRDSGAGCIGGGQCAELFLVLCPCIAIAAFFPLMVYGAIFGIPTVAVWLYCFLPFHGITIYFVIRVLFMNCKFSCRKCCGRLSEEEK